MYMSTTLRLSTWTSLLSIDHPKLFTMRAELGLVFLKGGDDAGLAHIRAVEDEMEAHQGLADT